MSNVTVIAHITEGEISPTYHVIGAGVRLFVVDDNHPGDRVFEWLGRSPESVIGELIPEGSSIGSSQDQRHAAVTNSIDALVNDRPRFTIVPDCPSPVHDRENDRG
ncbi:hypothetical protein ASF33_21960 [Methylobacterium sp. Leaf92]|nr:hypothetical protein ASF33_21960 [Methylobacterium sp. Leaf92]